MTKRVVFLTLLLLPLCTMAWASPQDLSAVQATGSPPNWIQLPDEFVGRLGSQVVEVDGIQYIRACMQLPNADCAFGPLVLRDWPGWGAPMGPRVISGCASRDLGRAYVLAEFGAGVDIGYQCWIFDIKRNRYVQSIDWDEDTQKIVSLEVIPGTDFLVESSVCVNWKSSVQCDAPPLRVRVIDREYKTLWTAQFDMDALSKLDVRSAALFDFLRAHPETVVAVEPGGFSVVSSSSDRNARFIVQENDESGYVIERKSDDGAAALPGLR